LGVRDEVPRKPGRESKDQGEETMKRVFMKRLLVFAALAELVIIPEYLWDMPLLW